MIFKKKFREIKQNERAKDKSNMNVTLIKIQKGKLEYTGISINLL